MNFLAVMLPIIPIVTYIIAIVTLERLLKNFFQSDCP